jgi:hypothetical protein
VIIIDELPFVKSVAQESALAGQKEGSHDATWFVDKGGHGPFRGLDAPFALRKNLVSCGGEVNMKRGRPAPQINAPRSDIFHFGDEILLN